MVHGNIGRGLTVLLLAAGMAGAVQGEPLAPAASRPLAAGGKTILVEIQGEIELGLAAFIERALKQAGEGDLVVFHVNTPGGRIDAAIAIRDIILESRAHSVAFIDRRAISAGAFISLAADTIVMAPGALFGDATPVTIEGGKMAPVEAKVVSYFRKEMKETAKAKGHCSNLPQARDNCGLIAEAMVDGDVQVEGVSDKGKPLILDTDQALKIGMAAFSAKSIDDVLEHFGREGGTRALKPAVNWAERIARFLSKPTVSSLLMTLGMLGILIELWAPGHAVAGALGVACLFLFFFGHYVVHLAGWEEIILFVVGVAALAFEIFFWSGHGLLAVAGVVAILLSLILALVNMRHVPFDVGWSLGWVPKALVRVFASILATTVAMFIFAKFLPRTRFGRGLILEQRLTESAGAAAAQAVGMGGTAEAGGGEGLVGRDGIAETALRPAGKVKIEGRRLDVVAEDGFVEQGTPVVIVAVDQARIVVRRQKT